MTKVQQTVTETFGTPLETWVLVIVLTKTPSPTQYQPSKETRPPLSCFAVITTAKGRSTPTVTTCLLDVMVRRELF